MTSDVEVYSNYLESMLWIIAYVLRSRKCKRFITSESTADQMLKLNKPVWRRALKRSKTSLRVAIIFLHVCNLEVLKFKNRASSIQNLVVIVIQSARIMICKSELSETTNNITITWSSWLLGFRTSDPYVRV